MNNDPRQNVPVGKKQSSERLVTLADPLHRCALGQNSELCFCSGQNRRKARCFLRLGRGKRQFRWLNVLQLQLVIERSEAAPPDPEVVLEQSPLIQH